MSEREHEWQHVPGSVLCARCGVCWHTAADLAERGGVSLCDSELRASHCPHVARGGRIDAYVRIEAPNGQARYGAPLEQVDVNVYTSPAVHGSFVCARCKHAMLHTLYETIQATDWKHGTVTERGPHER